MIGYFNSCMKATLSLEWIGQHQDFLAESHQPKLKFMGHGWHRRPTVKEIVGLDGDNFKTVLVRSKTSYKHANGKGTRGVYVWFILESGKLYYVHYYKTWTRRDSYFCRVTPESEIEKITESEVVKCLKIP